MRANHREIAKCGRPLCIDRDTETDLVARRNILTGLWAAKVLGLPAETHAAYAWSVHFADFEEPGDEDVLAKLSADMKRRGVQVSYRRLRRELKENELRAFFQIALVGGKTPRRARPWRTADH
jgi:hypothetical protein